MYGRRTYSQTSDKVENMMLSTVYGIYVVLGMSLNYDEVKLNTNVPKI